MARHAGNTVKKCIVICSQPAPAAQPRLLYTSSLLTIYAFKHGQFPGGPSLAKIIGSLSCRCPQLL